MSLKHTYISYTPELLKCSFVTQVGPISPNINHPKHRRLLSPTHPVPTIFDWRKSNFKRQFNLPCLSYRNLNEKKACLWNTVTYRARRCVSWLTLWRHTRQIIEVNGKLWVYTLCYTWYTKPQIGNLIILYLNKWMSKSSGWVHRLMPRESILSYPEFQIISSLFYVFGYLQQFRQSQGNYSDSHQLKISPHWIP